MVNDTTSNITSQSYSTVTVISVLSYVILMIVTVSGNALALRVFHRYVELRTPVNYLLINLAIADILKGGIQDGLVLCGLLTPDWGYNRVICNVSGFMLSAFHVGTIFTLTLTGIFRYLIVVNSMKHWITRKVVVAAILVIWLYACLIAFLPILGWNHYTYDKMQLLCLPNITMEISYPIFAITVDIMVPIFLLGYCYLRVYMVMRQNMRRTTVTLHGKTRSRSYSRLHKREVQMTRMMFSVYLAFVICYIPYVIQAYVLIPLQIDVPNVIVFLTGYILNTNSAINPFLYGFTSEKFRQVYSAYLCCLFSCRKRVMPSR
ncbi:Melanopsin-B [Trichoplax sp. H2]|uniref:G-protein coupled receptors family 1 profile domain-containing protein n=1 Tax=Trichoplax adhaerens TaxID=10228 RepID=B3RPP0_TRIAD|nr:hypothetical protein TRIADDRAFT_53608 [Trichoplax adhaerens]EDV27668.1 hypothetical protein TRIADDRAFT_53608 [Trichoplax adhaerens]RDD45282.1 Melanopsin-B [Trichoplax sp. H2]|eukprot:XP_002109502.1 hypothetical protein TRIADDRAFT_53608 [Trichoplax adhaerens]